MILKGQKLVDTLNSKCRNAKKRIWIASPFIGFIKDVKKIIGDVWMQPNIDFRILTDASHGFIKKDTFEEVKQLSCIRSLDSLHAKIYIIDDWCLITSANLTRTAFSKRYEIGSVVEEHDFADVESVYNEWWHKGTIVVSDKKVQSTSYRNYEEGVGFEEKWKLPKYTDSKANSYLLACKMYKEFAAIYEEVTGRYQDMVNKGFTRYQELDYFFNYLYHHHPGTPSKKYSKRSRKLSEKQMRANVRKYFNEMRKRMPYYDSNDNYRVKASKFIQKKLHVKNIDKISIEDVEQIVKYLHSVHDRNRNRFLNSNDIEVIKANWKDLLHTGNIDSGKINSVINNLKFWGPSSTKELIGWFYPNVYPIMNDNSNSGMRFFGYDVK